MQGGLASLEKIFRDDKTRRGLRRALILEILAMGLVHFTSLEPTLPPGCLTYLKNMMFYLH